MRIHNLLNINKTFLRAQFTFGVSLLITLIHIDNCCATTISQSLTNKSCQESLIPQHMEELANNMANLYLELFHRPTSSFTELSPESEASNQALWNDKLFEVETDWPGITMLIKSNVNKLLPDHLKVTYTQLNSEKNQKAINENLLNEFEIEDRKWNICRRTQQVQDEITNQLESFHNNQFSGLIILKFLFLNNNQIKSLNEHQFNHLQKLKLLYIQNNPLESNSISLILSYFKNKIGGVFKI